jgi:hypothetical protein
MSERNEDLNEEIAGDYTDFMDSLESKGVYLSGPIRCVDDNGVGWRQSLIDDYPEITFNSPLDNFSPETHDILNDPIQLDEDSGKKQILPSEYVLEDKIMINESEAVFVGLPNAVARGTMMETMYAYMRDIPFFVWIIDGQEESGWIYDHAEYMSESRADVVNELRQWLRDI